MNKDVGHTTLPDAAEIVKQTLKELNLSGGKDKTSKTVDIDIRVKNADDITKAREEVEAFDKIINKKNQNYLANSQEEAFKRMSAAMDAYNQKLASNATTNTLKRAANETTKWANTFEALGGDISKVDKQITTVVNNTRKNMSKPMLKNFSVDTFKEVYELIDKMSKSKVDFSQAFTGDLSSKLNEITKSATTATSQLDELSNATTKFNASSKTDTSINKSVDNIHKVTKEVNELSDSINKAQESKSKYNVNMQQAITAAGNIGNKKLEYSKDNEGNVKDFVGYVQQYLNMGGKFTAMTTRMQDNFRSLTDEGTESGRVMKSVIEEVNALTGNSVAIPSEKTIAIDNISKLLEKKFSKTQTSSQTETPLNNEELLKSREVIRSVQDDLKNFDITSLENLNSIIGNIDKVGTFKSLINALDQIHNGAISCNDALSLINKSIESSNVESPTIQTEKSLSLYEKLLELKQKVDAYDQTVNYVNGDAPFEFDYDKYVEQLKSIKSLMSEVFSGNEDFTNEKLDAYIQSLINDGKTLDIQLRSVGSDLKIFDAIDTQKDMPLESKIQWLEQISKQSKKGKQELSAFKEVFENVSVVLKNGKNIGISAFGDNFIKKTKDAKELMALINDHREDIASIDFLPKTTGIATRDEATDFYEHERQILDDMMSNVYAFNDQFVEQFQEAFQRAFTIDPSLVPDMERVIDLGLEDIVKKAKEAADAVKEIETPSGENESGLDKIEDQIQNVKKSAEQASTAIEKIEAPAVKSDNSIDKKADEILNIKKASEESLQAAKELCSSNFGDVGRESINKIALELDEFKAGAGNDIKNNVLTIISQDAKFATTCIGDLASEYAKVKEYINGKNIRIDPNYSSEFNDEYLKVRNTLGASVLRTDRGSDIAEFISEMNSTIGTNIELQDNPQNNLRKLYEYVSTLRDQVSALVKDFMKSNDITPVINNIVNGLQDQSNAIQNVTDNLEKETKAQQEATDMAAAAKKTTNGGSNGGSNGGTGGNGSGSGSNGGNGGGSDDDEIHLSEKERAEQTRQIIEELALSNKKYSVSVAENGRVVIATLDEENSEILKTVKSFSSLQNTLQGIEETGQNTITAGVGNFVKTYKSVSSMLTNISKMKTNLNIDYSDNDQQQLGIVKEMMGLETKLNTIKSSGKAITEQETTDLLQQLNLLSSQVSKIESTNKSVSTMVDRIGTIKNRLETSTNPLPKKELQDSFKLLNDFETKIKSLQSNKEGKSPIELKDLQSDLNSIDRYITKLERSNKTATSMSASSFNKAKGEYANNIRNLATQIQDASFDTSKLTKELEILKASLSSIKDSSGLANVRDQLRVINKEFKADKTANLSSQNTYNDIVSLQLTEYKQIYDIIGRINNLNSSTDNEQIQNLEKEKSLHEQNFLALEKQAKAFESGNMSMGQDRKANLNSVYNDYLSSQEKIRTSQDNAASKASYAEELEYLKKIQSLKISLLTADEKEQAGIQSQLADYQNIITEIQKTRREKNLETDTGNQELLNYEVKAYAELDALEDRLLSKKEKEAEINNRLSESTKSLVEQQVEPLKSRLTNAINKNSETDTSQLSSLKDRLVNPTVSFQITDGNYKEKLREIKENVTSTISQIQTQLGTETSTDVYKAYDWLIKNENKFQKARASVEAGTATSKETAAYRLLNAEKTRNIDITNNAVNENSAESAKRKEWTETIAKEATTYQTYFDQLSKGLNKGSSYNSVNQVIGQVNGKDISGALGMVTEYANTLGKLSGVKIDQSNDIAKFTLNLKDSSKAANTLVATLDKLSGEVKVVSISTKSGMSTFDKALSGFKDKWLKLTEYVTAMYLNPYMLIGNFKSLIQEVATFQDSLTQISYTMDLSDNELNHLGSSAISMSEKLGISVNSMMDILKVYSNMQTSTEDMLHKAEPTAILANLSGEDASTASDQIQAITNQFKLSEDDAMHIVDVMDYISSQIKMDFSKGISVIAEATKAAGSVVNDAGMDFETYAAMVAKASEVTRQSGSELGNSVKTIFTRISKASKLSSEVDNNTLSNASKSLNDVGIQVYKSNGEFNDIGDTLGKLAAKWNTLSDVQQSNIAFNVAATRQTNTLRAILNSYTDAVGLAADAENADGEAKADQEKHAESLSGRLQTLSDKWMEFKLSLADNGSIKGLVSSLSSLLSMVNDLTKSITPLGDALVAFAGYKAYKKNVGGTKMFVLEKYFMSIDGNIVLVGTTSFNITLVEIQQVKWVI